MHNNDSFSTMNFVYEIRTLIVKNIYENLSSSTLKYPLEVLYQFSYIISLTNNCGIL